MAELDALADVIEAFGDDASLADFPAARLTRDGLVDHRAVLVNELAEAEMAAVALVLEGTDLVGHGEADVSFLVETLSPFQDAVSAVGQALQSEPTSRSSIPAAIREPTRLRLVGIFDGSMGLSLRGPRPEPSLFGDDDDQTARPLFEQAVERVVDLLESTRPSFEGGHDDDDIVGHLNGLGSRAYAHLRRFAAAISSNDARARIVLQRRGEPPKATVLSKAGADRLQTILTNIQTDEREVKVQGHLVGASLVRDNFELAREDGTVISGKVHADTLPFLRSFFDMACTVTLKVQRTTATVSNLENEKYTLIHITEG